MEKAPPSAYWDNVRLKLEAVEEEAEWAKYCLHEALYNISEVGEQL